MINTVFPDTVAFKPTFVAFLQHSQTYVHGLSCHSSKFLWRRVNSKTPTILFGIVAFTFGTTFLEIAVNNIGSFVHCACIVYRVIEALKSYESTQIKSQNDRPSPEIPHEPRKFAGPRAGLWRWGGAGCSKNSTDGYFDGTAWNPRLRSPTPIMASGAKDSLCPHRSFQLL